MLLESFVEACLEDGQPTTARRVARRTGADTRAIDHMLRRLVKEGRARVLPRDTPGREPIYLRRTDP